MVSLLFKDPMNPILSTKLVSWEDKKIDKVAKLVLIQVKLITLRTKLSEDVYFFTDIF